MSDPTPTPANEPWDTTQTHDIEALRLAHASSPEVEVEAEVEVGQETIILSALHSLDPLPPVNAESTVTLSVGQPLMPDETQKLPIGAPTMANPVETQKFSVAPLAMPSPVETQILHREFRTIQMAPNEKPELGQKRMPLWGWVTISALLLLLLGALGIYLLQPKLPNPDGSETRLSEPASSSTTPTQGEPTPSPKSTEADTTSQIPPALRSYFKKAQEGDSAAMRMLGVMYYNGLNVPRNEQEGLKWYRKAAESGNKTAQKELMALEGKPLAQ